MEITNGAGAAIQLGQRRVTGMKEFTAVASVDRKTIVAEGVAELRLSRADGQPWPEWRAGAHIDLLLPDGIVRQYSLCGEQDDPSVWRIAVLKESSSRGGSTWVHEKMVVGDEVVVRGPRNHFELSDHDSYVFVAGGIGITPIIAMIEEVARRRKRWTLHYGGRSFSSMAFTEQLGESAANVHFYPEDQGERMLLQEILGAPSPGAGVYACGPIGLLDAVVRFEAVWPPDSIHVERFVVDESNLKHADDRPIEVYLAASDIALTVPASESILEAVERVGIGVLSSCRVGTCGTCETPVLEGEPDHRDSVLDEDDRAANDCMMICVSRALSPRLVLDL